MAAERSPAMGAARARGRAPRRRRERDGPRRLPRRGRLTRACPRARTRARPARVRRVRDVLPHRGPLLSRSPHGQDALRPPDARWTVAGPPRGRVGLARSDRSAGGAHRRRGAAGGRSRRLRRPLDARPPRHRRCLRAAAAVHRAGKHAGQLPGGHVARAVTPGAASHHTVPERPPARWRSPPVAGAGARRGCRPVRRATARQPARRRVPHAAAPFPARHRGREAASRWSWAGACCPATDRPSPGSSTTTARCTSSPHTAVSPCLPSSAGSGAKRSRRDRTTRYSSRSDPPGSPAESIFRIPGSCALPECSDFADGRGWRIAWPGSGGRLRLTGPRLMAMILGSVMASTANGTPSRPTPECLLPPKGMASIRKSPVSLIITAPTRSRGRRRGRGRGRG